MSTASRTSSPMTRLRFFFAILLGLTSPGAGIALVSSAEEGIRLYLARFLLSIIRIETEPTSNPNPILPEWGQHLLILMGVWGIWAIVDIVNVIRRIGTDKILPELRGPYPSPLLWLARCFILIGLLLIPSIYLPQPNYTQRFFWLLVIVGPFFIIIADRLLRRRSGWRIFTAVLMALALAQPLYVFYLLASGAILHTRLSSPLAWSIFISQIALILAVLVILFLPSTRAFFRKPETQSKIQPEVTKP